MSEQDLNSQDQMNPLEMSDEQIMGMDIFSDGLSPSVQDEETVESAEQGEVDNGAEEDTQAEFDLGTEEDPVAVTEEAEDTSEDTEAEEEGTEESETGDAEEEETSEVDDQTDYKAQVEQILAPFKANGKEIQVDSVEDALTLMRMGANYNKKMAALKPNLRIMRMLENQGLLDEEKLNYLIDLDKKKPEAISRLVKESGVDPLDINLDGTEDYTPESYRVDDREIALDEVLKSIQDTDTYNDTVDLVSSQWDAPSRDIIVNNPDLIRVINDHKMNGIYDQVAAAVEKDRMLGRLEGVSDIEAYRQVGDRLHAEGKFGSTEPNTNEANETVSKPEVKPKANPQLKNRKKAAGSSRAKPAKKAPTDFNPLAMSDEEFMKIASSQYM